MISKGKVTCYMNRKLKLNKHTEKPWEANRPSSTFDDGRIKQRAQFDCSSNSLLIHKLTTLLLFTAEGNPASPIQKTQIPLLAFFLSFIFSIETHTHAHTHSPFPFPANYPPPSCYLTGIRLDFWRKAAANRNFLCQIGRISWSEKS